MKEESIAVLMVAPGEHPVVTTLRNDLDSLQKAVSIGAEEQGLIELVSLSDDVALLCNEEGKLIGLEGNRRIGRDVIAGVFYLVGLGKDGNLTSLPKKEIDAYREQFWEIEHYTAADVENALFMRFFCC